MATYEDFLPDVRMKAYGVSDPVAEMYIRSAIIEFCEKTRVVNRICQEYAFAGDGRVELTDLDPKQETLEAVLGAWSDGVPMHPYAQPPGAFAPYATNFEGVSRGRPAYYFSIPGEPVTTLGVWPLPDEFRRNLVFRIAVKPTPGATKFDDVLVTDFKKAIVDGALAEIKQVAGHSFTDPTGADAADRRFRRAILDARVAFGTGAKVTGPQVVRPRLFAVRSR